MDGSTTVSPPTRGWTVTASGPEPGRPRGDGPLFRAWQGALDLVSPPTRGWTEPAILREILRFHRTFRLLRALRDGGFPAHAGMDPALCVPLPDDCAGFPAHAGMDPFPCRTDALPELHWFPRPRGDGPYVAC